MSKRPAVSRAVREREGGWLGFQGRALTADLRHIVGSLIGEAVNGTNGAERRGIRVRPCESGLLMTD